MFALRTKTGIKPNVGANLVFARRTKTDIKPMFENELETIASDKGLQPIVVRRANTRFAPTLVGSRLLRSTRRFMIAYLTIIIS